MYREGNRVTNWLTNMAVIMPIGSHDLNSPPSGVLGLLLEDISRACIPQFVRV